MCHAVVYAGNRFEFEKSTYPMKRYLVMHHSEYMTIMTTPIGWIFICLGMVFWALKNARWTRPRHFLLVQRIHKTLLF